VRKGTSGARDQHFPRELVRTSESRRYDRDFWAKVDQSGGLFACWPWLGPRHGQGYGRTWYNGGPVYAHRVAFALANGTSPAGLDICHTCDNPPCCNPAHLWAGTARDNLKDAAAKGRIRGGNLPGEAHPLHKLTWAAVRDIRARAASESQHALAREYHVSQVAVHFIVTGKTWRELTTDFRLSALCPDGAA
jgi:hypothetical protein